MRRAVKVGHWPALPSPSGAGSPSPLAPAPCSDSTASTCLFTAALYPATVFLNFLICLHCVKCHHSPPSSPPDLDSLPPNGSASCLHRISMHSLLGPCLGPWYHHPQQCTWIRNLGIILNSSPLTTHPHHHIGWSRNCTDCAFWNSFTILITSLTVQGPSFLAYLQESPSLTQCPQCTTLYPIIGTARAYLKSSPHHQHTKSKVLARIHTATIWPLPVFSGPFPVPTQSSSSHSQLVSQNKHWDDGPFTHVT